MCFGVQKPVVLPIQQWLPLTFSVLFNLSTECFLLSFPLPSSLSPTQIASLQLSIPILPISPLSPSNPIPSKFHLKSPTPLLTASQTSIPSWTIQTRACFFSQQNIQRAPWSSFQTFSFKISTMFVIFWFYYFVRLRASVMDQSCVLQKCWIWVMSWDFFYFRRVQSWMKFSLTSWIYSCTQFFIYSRRSSICSCKIANRLDFVLPVIIISINTLCTFLLPFSKFLTQCPLCIPQCRQSPHKGLQSQSQQKCETYSVIWLRQGVLSSKEVSQLFRRNLPVLRLLSDFGLVFRVEGALGDRLSYIIIYSVRVWVLNWLFRCNCFGKTNYIYGYEFLLLVFLEACCEDHCIVNDQGK